MLKLILGGARSGKSRHALSFQQQDRRHFFIATGEALDDEMRMRIDVHQAERGEQWQTIECPIEIAKTIDDIDSSDALVIIDCMTLWLSNLIHYDKNIEEHTEQLIRRLTHADGEYILVSNEVGLGIVPDNALSRSFRDQQGRLNQRLAAAADSVELLVAGIPLTIKGF